MVSKHTEIAESGAVLEVQDMNVQAGPRDLLFVEDLKILPKEVVGITGANGAGKTTFLKCLTGEYDCRGIIRIARDSFLGYLPQQAVQPGNQKTVWEEASSQMVRLKKLEKAMADTQSRMEEDPTDLGAMQEYSNLIDQYAMLGGYDQDQKIGDMLKGLGFTESDWDRKVNSLSGGWQMRVALARLLLSEPNILLLDEPTNHLDIRAKQYLRQFLANYPFSVMFVSHDKPLLESATRIIELRGQKIHDYSGNYSYFLEERDRRQQALEAQRARQQEEIDKLQGFIDRFGAKATKASAAKSKEKAIERIKLVEVPIDAEASTRRMALKIPKAPACKFETMKMVNCDVGWPGSPEPLIRNVNLTLEREQRLCIVGGNGQGKSTLLRTLGGLLEPFNGKVDSNGVARVRLGDERVSVGVFTQDLAADLPIEKTPLEFLASEINPDAKMVELRSALGALGLSGDDAIRPIKFLSGGEKARVAVTAFTVANPAHNVLLWDEPSNHLDMESVNRLIDALKVFDGTVVLVTHDERLIKALGTHSVIVQNGKMSDVYFGVPPQVLEIVQHSDDGCTTERLKLNGHASQRMSSSSDSDSDDDRKKRTQDNEERRRLRKEYDRAKKSIPKLELKIEELENSIGKLDDDLAAAGTNMSKVRELAAKRSNLQKELDTTYEQYEAAEGIMARMEADKVVA